MDDILKLKNITKLYPGVRALSDVSLSFKQGEVHAIVGENGAGKSTMIKIVSGAIEPTSGQIEINGTSFDRLDPITSKKNGISVIYQEFTLIPVLLVLENIFLGEYELKGMVLDKTSMRKKALDIFRRLNIHIDPDEKVSDLTTGYQQIVEITKALSRDAKILIMDEPSAPLTSNEAEAMFTIVDRLKEEGVTIIYISHRLDEIFRLSSRVSVMRDGQYINTLKTSETSRKELIKHMVGRSLNEAYPVREPIAEVDEILSVNGLTGNGVRDISFTLNRGEVLGIAGLMGAGRTEMASLLFGLEPIEAGEVYLNGKRITIKSPNDAMEHGIAFVPEDRKRHGVILNMSVGHNMTLVKLPLLSRFFVNSPAREQALINEFIKGMRIKTPHAKQLVKNLSGGNQQKIVLAKWMAMLPAVIIFDEPTRGIDVEAKQEIYLLINELVSQGKGVIMISSDMEELLGMSDRILVINKGRVTQTLDKKPFSQEIVLAYSTQEKEGGVGT